MFKCIWIQFRADDVDEQGSPTSREPRKLRRALECGGFPELIHKVRCCWLSEHKTSLNLQVDQNINLEWLVSNYFPGGVVGIINPEPRIPESAKLDTYKAKVLPTAMAA